MSAFLFALDIEPLAELLRASPQFTGLWNGTLEERVSLYADDMLLYLSDPLNSIPIALEIIQEFGRYSRFKVKLDKVLHLPH